MPSKVYSNTITMEFGCVRVYSYPRFIILFIVTGIVLVKQETFIFMLNVRFVTFGATIGPQVFAAVPRGVLEGRDICSAGAGLA